MQKPLFQTVSHEGSRTGQPGLPKDIFYILQGIGIGYFLSKDFLEIRKKLRFFSGISGDLPCFPLLIRIIDSINRTRFPPKKTKYLATPGRDGISWHYICMNRAESINRLPCIPENKKDTDFRSQEDNMLIDLGYDLQRLGSVCYEEGGTFGTLPGTICCSAGCTVCVSGCSFSRKDGVVILGNYTA
jgi:hypothetical protein